MEHRKTRELPQINPLFLAAQFLLIPVCLYAMFAFLPLVEVFTKDFRGTLLAFYTLSPWFLGIVALFVLLSAQRASSQALAGVALVGYLLNVLLGAGVLGSPGFVNRELTAVVFFFFSPIVLLLSMLWESQTKELAATCWFRKALGANALFYIGSWLFVMKVQPSGFLVMALVTLGLVAMTCIIVGSIVVLKEAMVREAGDSTSAVPQGLLQ